MCLTIAYFTGWTLTELKQLPIGELRNWYRDVVDLHKLNEKESNPGRTR